MGLIDKDALVAEIERRLHFDNNWIEGDKRRQMHTNGVSSVYYRMIGSKNACESLLDFINTLKVKEVDLEKVFNDEYLKFSNDTDAGDYAFPIDLADYRDFAKHFFELGLKAAQKGK